jgi:hypothetical protein
MSQRPNKQTSQANTGSSNPTTSTKAVVASGGNNHNGELVSDVDIRLCAYQKWEAAGKPAGNGVQFWLSAEQELQAAHHHDHGNHEEAKKHATSAQDHSQDADRHSKTAHQQSQK